MLDPETLRAAARLARLRAHPTTGHDHRDGMERLGAQRALEQLADDLEVTARHAEGSSEEDGEDAR
jgi:hypothetical protein